MPADCEPWPGNKNAVFNMNVEVRRSFPTGNRAIPIVVRQPERTEKLGRQYYWADSKKTEDKIQHPFRLVLRLNS